MNGEHGACNYEIKRLENELSRLRAVNAEQGETLKSIAEIAHCGGLAHLSEWEFAVAIRKLSLPYWDKRGNEEETRKRVYAALSRTGPAGKAEGRQG